MCGFQEIKSFSYAVSLYGLGSFIRSNRGNLHIEPRLESSVDFTYHENVEASISTAQCEICWNWE
jgi:hypothetical protein